MPTLKAFGRSWSIASDDFVFPQITEGILRCVWFVTALGIYAIHTRPNKCPDGQIPAADLATFAMLLLVHNALLIFLCFLTAWMSSRGTIMNGHKRRFIPQLVYLRLPLFAFEVIWNILGTVWIAEGREGCEEEMRRGIRLTVILNWVIIVTFVLGVFVVFNPLGKLHHQDHSLTMEKTKRLWRRRLRLFCYCATAGDNSKNALEDVADLMSCFFSDNDLVLSDVWAGMLLLANKEMRAMTDRPSIEPDVRDRPDWMNLTLASRIMDFAMGVYGWPTYSLNNCTSCSAQCDLLHRLNCCRDCRCDQVLIVKDNCCQCNTAALLLTTNISESDLFYVSFNNRICEVPFVACADPVSKSIVIAIRGTMSLHDIVTDLCAADDTLTFHPPEPIDMTDAAPNTEQPIRNQQESRVLSDIDGDARVHRGMLNSARFVYQTLDKQKILEDMFVLYPDYSLVVTGHSLGAGVAALVGLMLRPQFPAVRCFSFSPPGCVVNKDAIESTEKFICSVVVGDDLVPRMSYQTMHRLKQNIIDAITHCEQAKYEILLKGCFKLLCGRRPPPAASADVEVPPPDPVATVSVVSPEWSALPRSLPSTSVGRQELSSSTSTNDLAPLITQRTSSYGTEEELNISMPQFASGSGILLFPPGRIMHVTPPEEDGDRPFVEWINYRRLADIRLSSSMISDHMPYQVRNALRLAAATAGDTWNLIP